MAKLLTFIFGLLSSVWANAATIYPPGKTDWDLYVFGNGRVIYEVLLSIKLLMMPDSGSTGFTTLLLVMALIGFFVLAIGAAFEPAKNFIRMFTYVLVVWFISFGSTVLKANVVITDVVNNSLTSFAPIYRVEGVPALVALPAVLTSQVGRYFTRAVETYFSTPEELKVGGQAAGQFNLFGKMLQESSQYVITSPELKKSLQQYVADCAIPAIALGKLKGEVPDSSAPNSTKTAYGATVLLQSTNLLAALDSARNLSIFTKYYPYSLDDMSWVGRAPELTTLLSGVNNIAQYASTGVLMTCDSAYKNIYADINAHADSLVNAGASGWAKSGVAVPFQSAMQSVLTHSGMTGTSGQPNGYILQQSLINSMNGSFRQAAIQTGNNPIMMAAQLSQAEVSQWSTWAAGFAMFNNTMGYVYIVLQAFIFAITPFILVALFIPGMGKAIFVNYAQILVWLTLWMPLLSVINFLITLFGVDSVGAAMGSAGGPSLSNKALMSEAVNHLMLAAGFLGTMVPLISWGIVKGAMAFTEFINNGIGSQFAAQAGAGAATGNLSMNNLSMDNTSMNKFSTMHSAQVGYQGVQAGVNAGAGTFQADAGGSAASMNGQAVSMKQALSEGLSQALQQSQQVQSALQDMRSHGISVQELMDRAAGRSGSVAEQQAAQTAVSSALSVASQKDASVSQDAAQVTSFLRSASENLNSNNEVSINAGGKFGLGPVGAGVDARSGQATGLSNLTTGQEAATGGTSSKVGTSHSEQTQAQQSASEAFSRVLGISKDSSERAGLSSNSTFQQAVSNSLSESMAYSSSLSAGLSVSKSMEFGNGVTLSDVNDVVNRVQAMSSSMGGAASSMSSSMGDMLGGLSANSERTLAAYETQRTAAAAAYSGHSNAANPGTLSAPDSSGFLNDKALINQQMGGVGAAVAGGTANTVVQQTNLDKRVSADRKKEGPAKIVDGIMSLGR